VAPQAKRQRATAQPFNILPTDIGRRITELRPNIDVPDLENILRDVIETLATRVRKVANKEGRECLLRVRPYRTTDNKIDGAVVTLVEVERKKESYAGKMPNPASKARRGNKIGGQGATVKSRHRLGASCAN
jgi:hypothetical protein